MDSPRIERGSPRCKRGILPLDYEPPEFITNFAQNNLFIYKMCRKKYISF